MKLPCFILLGMALALATSGKLHAQPNLVDDALYLRAFFTWVLEQHPAASRAALLDQESQAALRAARGAFDPKAFADWQQKIFAGTEYYQLGEMGVKAPTWLGLELKGSFTRSGGAFLNPEDRLPGAGQAVLGLRAPLLQGLFWDAARADFRQAQLLAPFNQAEQALMLNDLLLLAGKAYWDWAAAFQQLQVFRQALELAERRFDMAVQSFIQGDIPAIDTLETFLQVQNRRLDLNDAENEWRNASLYLDNFLWLNGRPARMATSTLRPPEWARIESHLPLFNADEYAAAARMHPLLEQYRIQLQQLEVERRLAAEYLKPRLDVEYNLLGNGFDFAYAPGFSDPNLVDQLTNNFKWGLHFHFPLLLRKERGKLALTKIKVNETEFKLNEKTLEIDNKIREYYNEWTNLNAQLALFRDILGNYQRLLEVENRKFSIGESSVFLINIREQSLVDAQVKAVKLEAQARKALLELEWAACRLHVLY
jgi:outer membrane protein TolC